MQNNYDSEQVISRVMLLLVMGFPDFKQKLEFADLAPLCSYYLLWPMYLNVVLLMFLGLVSCVWYCVVSARNANFIGDFPLVNA